MKLSYTYMITELSTNMKYIGVRSSNEPLKDIGIKYFSSSTDKSFIINQQENKNNYSYKILEIFDERNDANNHEIELHKKYNVSINPQFYNKSNAISTGFDTTNRVTVIDIDGKYISISKDDPRWINKELKSHLYEKVSVRNMNGQCISVSINDIRYKSGEYKHINFGKVVVHDKNIDSYISVSVNDPRYLSGELVANTSKNIVCIDNKNKIHFVDKTDIRYLSGELKSIFSNTVPVYDRITCSYIRVSVNDERISTGELEYITNGKVFVKDVYGKGYYVNTDDNRIVNGELTGHLSNWYLIDGVIYNTKILCVLYNITASAIKNRNWLCLGNTVNIECINKYKVFSCNNLESLRGTYYIEVPCILVKDVYGNKFKVCKGDARLTTYEVTGNTGKWFIINNFICSAQLLKIKYKLSSGDFNRRVKFYGLKEIDKLTSHEYKLLTFDNFELYDGPDLSIKLPRNKGII